MKSMTAVQGIVAKVWKLCDVLHDVNGNIELGDSLAADGVPLPDADVIITNPTFGCEGALVAEMPQSHDISARSQSRGFGHGQHGRHGATEP
jgi:hypothetical protein